MDKISLSENLKNKEIFINDVLKEELKNLDTQLQKINDDISDISQDREVLKLLTDKNTHPNGFKTQVNIGCNFFMEAAVVDTSKMLINIGLDHYLELSLREAHKYIDTRICVLQSNADELKKKIAEIKAQIKLIMLSMLESATPDANKS